MIKLLRLLLLLLAFSAQAAQIAQIEDQDLQEDSQEENSEDEESSDELLVAIRHEDVDLVKSLIAQQAEVNCFSLYRAVRTENIKLVQEILKSPNCFDGHDDAAYLMLNHPLFISSLNRFMMHDCADLMITNKPEFITTILQSDKCPFDVVCHGIEQLFDKNRLDLAKSVVDIAQDKINVEFKYGPKSYTLLTFFLHDEHPMSLEIAKYIYSLPNCVLNPIMTDESGFRRNLLHDLLDADINEKTILGLKYLIKADNIDINFVGGPNNSTVLFKIIRVNKFRGYVDENSDRAPLSFLKALLESNKLDLNIACPESILPPARLKTALEFAIDLDEVEVIKTILAANTNINLGIDSEQRRKCIRATGGANKQELRDILFKKLSVVDKGEFLFKALDNDDAETFIATAYHTPLNAYNGIGNNPLHEAIKKGRIKIMVFILIYAPNLLTRKNKNGNTPFDLVIGHPQILKLWLSLGKAQIGSGTGAKRVKVG